MATFRLGINFPWVACGHDFGRHPAPWAGAPRTPWDEVERELSDHRALGVQVVRWWVFAGGVNFPCEHGMRDHGRRVPMDSLYARGRRALGGSIPERFEILAAPPPLSAEVLEDFERLLELAARTNVTIWPSWLSFEWFLPIRDEPAGVTSGGRGGFAHAPHRAAFLDAALEPLLAISDRHPAAIEAFEVMNEPEWTIARDVDPRFRRHPPLHEPVVIDAFLLDATARIVAHGHRATIGFVSARAAFMRASSLEILGGLAARDRYVHQVHHYPRWRGDRLPPARESPIRPCWVGEVATSRHARWRDPGLREDDPETFLQRRIERVRDAGYRGVMLWAARATDPHVSWDARTKAQLRRAAISCL